MKVIFHVGYPKCGSTTLQKNLFAQSSCLNDLSANGCHPDGPAGTSAREFTNAVISTDDGALQRARTIWEKDITKGMSVERVNVFSREHFVIGDASTDVVFSRLASLHEGSHVMLVVRSPHEIIRSLYDMYPVIDPAERASPRSDPLPEYVNAILELDKPFAADTFRIAARIEEAKANFGEDRVHVFRFDGLFRTDEEIGRLAELLEIEASHVRSLLSAPPANEFAEHAAHRKIRKFLGPVRGSWFLSHEKLIALNRWLAPFIGVKRTEMPSNLVDSIKAYYAEDNARLAELVPEVGRLS